MCNEARHVKKRDGSSWPLDGAPPLRAPVPRLSVSTRFVATRTTVFKEEKRRKESIRGIGRVASRAEADGEKRERKRDEDGERGTVVGRHRERRSPGGARKAATIIFHRRKRKGRTPFISPGSVGSHVVWCRCL